MDKNIKEIKTIIENWLEAIHRKDINGILENHSEDMLMFDVPFPIQSNGLDEYRKTWDLFFQYSNGGKESFQLEDLTIHAGDRVAFCTALIKLSNNPSPQCRLTIGLKKTNRQWLIIHEHHSAPHKII